MNRLPTRFIRSILKDLYKSLFHWLVNVTIYSVRYSQDKLEISYKMEISSHEICTKHNPIDNNYIINDEIIRMKPSRHGHICMLRTKTQLCCYAPRKRGVPSWMPILNPAWTKSVRVRGLVKESAGCRSDGMWETTNKPFAILSWGK